MDGPLAAELQDAQVTKHRQANFDAPSRFQAFTLWAGAIGGIILFALLRRVNFSWSSEAWNIWLLTFYSALTGAAMPAMLWLIYDRVRWGRHWHSGGMALLMGGTVSWLFLLLVADSTAPFSFYINPNRWYGTLRGVPPWKAECLAAFYQCWPLTCVAWLIGCQLGGQAGRTWPDRLGWWLIFAWALPASFTIYHSIMHLFFYEKIHAF